MSNSEQQSMQLNNDPTSNITSPNGGSRSTTGSVTPVMSNPPGELTSDNMPTRNESPPAQSASIPQSTAAPPVGSYYSGQQVPQYQSQQPPSAASYMQQPPPSHDFSMHNAAMTSNSYQHQPNSGGGGGAPSGENGAQDTSGKLFVGQVPYITNEDQLKPLFQPYGNILEIKIMRDHDQRSRGCAWVRYDTKEEAQQAIDSLHNKHTIPPQTNLLQVRFAQQGGGGGGGGGGGRGGGRGRGAPRGGGYQGRGGGGGYRGGGGGGYGGGRGGYNAALYNPMGMMGGYGGMQMPMPPTQPQFRTNNNPYQATTVGSSGWDNGGGGGGASAPGYYSTPGMLQNESSAMNAMMNTFVSHAGGGAMPSPHQTTHLPYYATSGNPSSGTSNGGGGQDQGANGGGGGWNQGGY